ncbi:MAG: AAA family ATPase [Schwartzia sp.]|nr:AAA family ATPase [Schwartzia sp. (in: firmicutes)]
MAKIIAIANQKGGVGKTTTAVNLSACLGKLGKRVLLVDFDPQGNATTGCGLDKTSLEKSVYQVIMRELNLKDAVQHTEYEIDVLPASIDLAGAEVELATSEERETRLKDALDAARGDYDYIIIDCPPSLGLLSLNSLAAADEILVPIQCEFYALEGLSQIVDTIDLVHEEINPDLQIAGVLLTMFDPRTNLSAQVVDEVKKFFEDKVFDTIIPRTVRLSEAPSYGMPVIAYDSAAKGAKVYMELAEEVLRRG